MVQELTESWRSNFGETPPLTHWMRVRHHQRWFRIHSLPQSKRYAEDKHEMAIVLERANTIASYILGDDQDVWMVSSTASDYRSEYERDGDAPIKLFGLTHWCDWTEPEDDPEYQIEWASFARKVHWRTGQFDSLLRRVADDEEEFVLWFSSTKNTVFAPYDGGVDVWAKSGEQVSSLHDRFQHWMSKRDDRM